MSGGAPPSPVIAARPAPEDRFEVSLPATVSIVRCADYDRARVREAVREALRLLPEAEAVLPLRGRVLLKPNLISSNDPPERAVNTHPEFIRAVAEFFIERGCKVFIGDSCGSLASGSTGRAIQVTGLREVASETGAELLDFDRLPARTARVPEARVLHAIQMPAVLATMDLIVTLPKFKTHGLTLMTGAVKNQLGVIPGKGKKDAHVAAPKPDLMAEALVDVHSAVRPRLAFMDAILGMEGNGPTAGDPRAVGLVLASADCVALDAVAAEIMGYAPGDIETTTAAAARGLGVGDLKDIRVAGCPLEAVRLKDFRKPPMNVRSAVHSLIPAAVLGWMYEQAGSTCADVLDDRCVICGECIANCPAAALREEQGRVRADPVRCISCYCCAEVCRRRAIRMRRPFAGRVVHALARALTGRWRRPRE